MKNAARALALRTSFGLGSRLAPRRTARRAADLWFTVPRRPMPAVPPEPPGGTTRILTGDRGPLWTRSWGTGPVVYFVHGWGGRGDQIHGFVEPLLRRGFQVVTFDAPGHGDSAVGATGHTNAVETAGALRIVVAAYGPAHAVIAHSLGAVATMIAIQRRWLDPARVALVAPVTEVRSQLNQFVDALGIGGPARQHLDAEVRRHSGLAVDDFGYSGRDDVLRRSAMVAAHDRQDQFISYAKTEALVSSWTHGRLLSTTGLGHVRILADPQVTEELAAWIDAAG